MPEKIPVSVLIMVKNEELNIRQCLESVKWADEIILVDSQSTDGTLGIAGEYTDKIYQYAWDAKQPKKSRSLEIPEFRHDWVLMLDADERATYDFKDEIEPLVTGENNGFAGYVARYHYWFSGRYIKFGDPVRKPVLFRRSKTHFEKYDISQAAAVRDLEVGHEHPIIEGRIGYVKSPLFHRDNRSLYRYFDRHNRYSDWESFLIYKGGYKDASAISVKPDMTKTWLSARRFMKHIFLNMPFKPFIYFVYSYVFRLGFLDGYPGFAYNICKAFYAFQIGLKIRAFKLEEK